MYFQRFQIQLYAETQCKRVLESAEMFGVCAYHVSLKTYVERCVSDMCATYVSNDKHPMCVIVASLAAECTRRNFYLPRKYTEWALENCRRQSCC